MIIVSPIGISTANVDDLCIFSVIYVPAGKQVINMSIAASVLNVLGDPSKNKTKLSLLMNLEIMEDLRK